MNSKTMTIYVITIITLSLAICSSSLFAINTFATSARIDPNSQNNTLNTIFPLIKNDKNHTKNQETEIIIQNTSTSTKTISTHGQLSHQVVFALPLIDNGKIYSGTVTFTASKPIEVEVLHTYAPAQKPDPLHGEPYHTVFPGNKTVAITHLRNIVDLPIEINGTKISSGSFNFVGNALVFHKINGDPFTVTYTIDAWVKDIGIYKYQ